MNICQGQHETLRNFHPQENESDFFQMEAWNTHKLSLSGNEIFSSGSMKHSELLTPRKMDMNNSHMETWWILTFRKMKMKILTLRCMLCVVQERKTWPTNILKSFRRQDAHMFFFNVWCSVLRTRKRICVSHNKGYTLLFQCVLFFPQCLALCEKNERYQMNKWMFFKMTDDVMPAVFLQKHVQFKINKWNSSFCECFWWPARVFDCEKLMIFCVLELSDAFWKNEFLLTLFSNKFCRKLIYRLLFVASTCIKKWTCMWNTTAWILDNCKLVHFEHQLIAMADEDAVKKTQKVAAEHVESELKFQYFC